MQAICDVIKGFEEVTIAAADARSSFFIESSEALFQIFTGMKSMMYSPISPELTRATAPAST